MCVDEFVERLRNKTLPANAVAVTFDDGYRDNLVHAKPVLARYGVPATLFLATGFIDQDAPFWWDELASMILASTQAAHDRQVLAGETVNLDWGEPDHSDMTGEWRAWNEPRTPRQRAYLAIWRRLRLATAEQRELAISSGLFREIVIHAQRIHAALVHEVLGHGRAGVRGNVLHGRGVGG